MYKSCSSQDMQIYKDGELLAWKNATKNTQLVHNMKLKLGKFPAMQI